MNYSIIRCICALVIGVLLVAWPEAAILYLVITIGVLFLVPGLFWLSGNFWLLSFKISYLCLPLFYETRTTPSCHPSGCAYRQL